IDRAAKRRPNARNWPSGRRESPQPAEQRFVLIERDVIEERVAAVEVPCDAAVLDVLRHGLGAIEVDGAPGAGVPGKRWNREYPRQFLNLDRAVSHVESIA